MVCISITVKTGKLFATGYDWHKKIQVFYSLRVAKWKWLPKNIMKHIPLNGNTFFLVAHLRRLVHWSQSHIYRCRNCRWLYTIRRSYKANCYMESLQQQWWRTSLAALIRVNVAWQIICVGYVSQLYILYYELTWRTRTRCIWADTLRSTI